jgi:hypothetical protein
MSKRIFSILLGILKGDVKVSILAKTEDNHN